MSKGHQPNLSTIERVERALLVLACYMELDGDVYPRGGYGTSSRSHILARPLPLIPNSLARRLIRVPGPSRTVPYASHAGLLGPSSTSVHRRHWHCRSQPITQRGKQDKLRPGENERLHRCLGMTFQRRQKIYVAETIT